MMGWKQHAKQSLKLFRRKARTFSTSHRNLVFRSERFPIGIYVTFRRLEFGKLRKSCRKRPQIRLHFPIGLSEAVLGKLQSELKIPRDALLYHLSM